MQLELCCYIAMLKAAVVAQGLERSPRKRKVSCLNPRRDRPKSFKQVVTAPLRNARH